MIFSLLIGATSHKVVAVTTIEASSQPSGILSFPIWIAYPFHFHLGLGGVLPKVLCIESHILTMSNLDFIGVVHGKPFITIIFIPWFTTLAFKATLTTLLIPRARARASLAFFAATLKAAISCITSFEVMRW